MKFKPVFVTIYLLSILVLFSCEFELDSKNFREIAPPDSNTTIQVDLSSFETQYMFTVPTLVNYDLNTFGLKVYNVEFYVGNQLIHSGTEAKGNFVFEPSPWGIGVQTMTMVIATSTNTGSLADLLESEALVFQQSWDVLLDGGNPNPVEITNIFNDNGILKIEWEEYERFNFQKYILYKNFGNIEADFEKHILAVITDQTIHSLYDSSFIGRTGIYWIEVYGSNQKATSQKKQFSATYPVLDTVWVKNDSVLFQWNKNNFFKAIDKVTLTTPDYYPKPDLVLFESENMNDTTSMVEGLKFGASTNYTLSFHPKSDIKIYQDNQILSSSVSFGIGEKIVEFGDFLKDPANEQFYISNTDGISKYKYPEMEIIETANPGVFVNWFISAYDQSLITLLNSTMTKYPDGDLSNPINYDSYDFGFHWFWSNSSVSTSNQMLGPVGFGAGLYDFNKEEMVFSQNESKYEACSLSPDGKYAFNTEYLGYGDQTVINLYEVTNDGLQAFGELQANVYSVMEWLPDNQHSLILLKGYQFQMEGQSSNEFAIYNLETKTYDSEFTVNIGDFSGIDIPTKQVAFYDRITGSDKLNKMYIYNYETGELLKDIKLFPDVYKLSLYHNHIFSSNGFCFNISK